MLVDKVPQLPTALLPIKTKSLRKGALVTQAGNAQIKLQAKTALTSPKRKRAKMQSLLFAGGFAF